MIVDVSFCFRSYPEISAAGCPKDTERSREYKWRLNKTTHFHLKRSLQSMDLAPMAFKTLSGFEIRHRVEPKGGGCRPATLPPKIDI